MSARPWCSGIFRPKNSCRRQLRRRVIEACDVFAVTARPARSTFTRATRTTSQKALPYYLESTGDGDLESLEIVKSDRFQPRLTVLDPHLYIGPLWNNDTATDIQIVLNEHAVCLGVLCPRVNVSAYRLETGL